MTVYDYSGYSDTDQQQDTDKLTQLTRLVNEQAAIEAKIAQTEDTLKKLQGELKTISEETIPDLMVQVGLRTFKTLEGVPVELKEEIFCNISEERSQSAYRWLRENQYASIIKREISVPFDKDQQQEADDFFEQIMSDGHFMAKDKQSVHSSTLKAFVKEQLERGENFPLELFGVHRRNVAKIKKR